eukprot:3573041-Heterocapsa_arctica.AAC.1
MGASHLLRPELREVVRDGAEAGPRRARPPSTSVEAVHGAGAARWRRPGPRPGVGRRPAMGARDQRLVAARRADPREGG